MPQTSTLDRMVINLHTARFHTYLTAAGGDREAALQLYRWNLDVSSALHSTLALVEVVLRNAIDRELRVWNARQPDGRGGVHRSEWLDDPARPLNSMLKAARSSARANALKARAARSPAHPRKNAEITHDDLLAQLTFGVFAKLLPTTDRTARDFTARRVLWTQALVHAFPQTRTLDPDGITVEGRVTRLDAVRNRVAHMEPLLEVNIVSRYRDAVRLVGAVDPAVQGWVSGVSRVQEVARSRPRTMQTSGGSPIQRAE